MSEEKVTLSGVPAPQDGEDKSIEKSESESGDENQTMTSDAPDLSGTLEAGASQQDVLAKILSSKPEELIPWEPATLPSRGLYYNGQIPNGQLEVRAMGLQTDKIWATPRLTKTGVAFDYVLRHCVKFPTPNFDPLDMLSNDRVFLLYYLRGITHGNEYEFAIECTDDECGLMSTHLYDLNELASTMVFPTTNDPEPFTVRLPYMSQAYKRDISIEVRFMRGRDEQAMLQRERLTKQIATSAGVKKPVSGDGGRMPEQSSKPMTVDQRLEQFLHLLVVSVMGSRQPHVIQDFVKRLHARDTSTIREFLRNNTPGIDTTIKIECPHCGNKMVMELPFTESFFRTTDNRGAGTGVGTPDGAIVPT